MPLPADPACFFLDFDGTLVDFAPTPGEVRRDPDLIGLLQRLAGRFDGAVAIVSGRSIATLDSLLAPLRLPLAGLHGLERRGADGTLHALRAAPAWLQGLRPALTRHVATHAGLVLEDKTAALAVHFRKAPEHAAVTRALLSALHRTLPTDAQLLEGEAVLELRPGSQDKGTAVEAFLQESGFAGRKPVFIGDDLTDSAGHAAVTRRGGMAIAVGNRVSAPWRLSGPSAVRTWLNRCVAHVAPR